MQCLHARLWCETAFTIVLRTILVKKKCSSFTWQQPLILRMILEKSRTTQGKLYKGFLFPRKSKENCTIQRNRLEEDRCELSGHHCTWRNSWTWKYNTCEPGSHWVTHKVRVFPPQIFWCVTHHHGTSTGHCFFAECIVVLFGDDQLGDHTNNRFFSSVLNCQVHAMESRHTSVLILRPAMKNLWQTKVESGQERHRYVSWIWKNQILLFSITSFVFHLFVFGESTSAPNVSWANKK